MKSSAQLLFELFRSTVAILFLTASAAGTPGWHWSHPLPTGLWVDAVEFVDADHGWISASGNYDPYTYMSELFRTQDGGATWQKLGEFVRLHDLCFLNSVSGWACGDDGTILRTTDGGVSWTSQSSGTTETLLTIEFIDANWGTAGGVDGVICRTNNGGATWFAQGSGTTNSMTDISFLDSMNGFVSTLTSYLSSPGIVLRTNSAGAFWEQLSTGTYNCQTAVDFIDLQNGWLAAYDYFSTQGNILHTSDGGTTWTIQTSMDAHVRDLEMLDASTGVSCGDGSTVAVTTNGGSNWVPGVIPFVDGEQVNLCSVSFPTAGAAFCGGLWGALFSTTDLANWESISSRITMSPLRAITCTDPWRIWACGDDGVILHSDNGGVAWELQMPPDPLITRLNDICFVDASTGYACGWHETGKGLILRTGDGGQNWEDCSPTLLDLRSLYSVAFTDPGMGAAVGAQGEVLQTNDGGDSWYRVTGLTSYTLNRIRLGGGTSGFASGEHGTILHFDLAADTWTMQFSSTTGGLYTLFCLDADTAWAAGWNGTVVRTFNGGDNWIKIAETGNDYTDIWFSDASHGYLQSGGMYTTSDGGVTMQQFPGGLDNSISSFSFLDTSNGWGCGYGGAILRFGETVTGIESPEPDIPVTPVSLVLSQNPFQGSASVSFNVPGGPSPVSLVLYDLAGRRVMTLLDGVLPAGAHSTDIGAGGLPAGVYVLRLDCGGLVSTRTCVKLP